MASWQVRILILKDGECIGIFNSDADVKSIMLSCTGEFVYITNSTGTSSCHLTRFTPRRYFSCVKRVLNFRNKHAETPFLCERFHPATSTVAKNEITTVWPSVFPTQLHEEEEISSSGAQWETLESIDRKCCLQKCPYGRRLRFVSTAVYNPDALIEGGHRQISSTLHTASAVTLVSTYPVHRAPPLLLSLIQRNEESVRTALPSSFSSSAPSSTSALAFFQELSSEMHFLQDINAYPTATDSLLIIAESIDDVTYCLNTPPPGRIEGYGTSSLRDAAGNIEVDAWIGQATVHSRLEPLDEYDCDPTDKEGAVVLSLKSDFFTIYQPSTKDGLLIHMSLLPLDLLSESNYDGSLHAVNTDSASSSIWRLRKHALRLIKFRDYLEMNGSLLPSASSPRPLQSFACDAFGVGVVPETVAPREPITLHTSNGTKFVAFTNLNGDGSIVALRGAFPDRHLVQLCLRTSMASCVLPDGRSTTYTLDDCMSASNSDDLVDSLTCHYISSHISTQSRPSATTASHVRSLLAFRRWAQTPPHLRHELEQQDRQISRVAQAAALQNQRHVLLHCMLSSSTSRVEAVLDTQALKDRLMLVGRDASLALAEGIPGPPLYSTTELGVANVPELRVDPKLSASLHNIHIRKLAKEQVEKCKLFVAKGIVK